MRYGGIVGTRAAALVAAGLTAGVLLVWAASSAPVQVLTDDRPTLPEATISPVTGTGRPVAHATGLFPHWVDQLLMVLGVIVLLLLGWLLVRQVVRQVRGTRQQQWSPRANPVRVPAPPPVGEEDLVGASIAGRHRDRLAALATGSPRNAIVACWLDLEQTVTTSGIAVDPALTSVELTERVLGTLDVDQASVLALARLYREARFSQHPLDEGHRSAAVQAVQRLHTDLSVTVVPEPSARGDRQ